MTALQQTFRVAIYDEFLDAFAGIPRAQQKKVNKFLRKFRDDPTSPSINYEKMHTFKDQNLRTVRIDDAYRAVVLKPADGNVYVMLWVDHHDDAIAWAQNKQITIHSETGAIQVLSGEHIEAAAREVKPEPGAKALFEGIRDRELLRLGVPEPLLPGVRELQTPEQLAALQPALPAEAFEALFFLSEGESLEEVEQAMAITPVDNVDPGDFQAALERDATKRHFVLVDNDEALEAMLDAPLEKWRIFLHPSQRKLVDRSWNGPVRVLGGAGTGKTVVAMHRAAYLAEKVFSADTDRILFTTFTRNLAADIEANLAKLCAPQAVKRIDVVHLDKWVSDLLRKAGYEYTIAYWGSKNQRLEKLWDQALAFASAEGFPESFYRDEWEQVVQPAGCEQWENYKDASRSGRGRRLSRGQRKELWPVFEEYRHLLERERLREPEDALRDATALLQQGKAQAGYRSIVADEAQDLSTAAFRLLRQVIPEERPDDMFIVGDGHQRIYRKQVVLGRAGVKITGRARRLRINYRTTDEIRRYAVALLEGIEVDDLDAGTDTTKGYRSLMHGAAPTVRILNSFDAEVQAVAEWAQQGDLQKTCLVARTNALRDQYEAALKAKGIQTYPIKRSTAEDLSAPGLRVATMHRVKGLEFDRMILAGMSEANMPWSAAVTRSEDDAVRAETEKMERALFYVAITRAKREALITAHGKASPWITLQ